MSRKLTTKEFIEKAQKFHGDTYSYEKTAYVSAHSKVTVTCKVHGDFEITPDSHVNGKYKSGCAKCKAVNLGNHNRGSVDKFVAKSKEVHGDRYDYSLVEYKTTHAKVKVICKTHGVFECMPLNHQRGKGCPKCAGYGYRPNLPGYLYVLSDDNVTKIGITNRSAEQRTKEIIKSSGLSFTKRFSLYFEDGSIPQRIEAALLQELRNTYEQTDSIYDGSTESFIGVDLDSLLARINEEVNFS